MVDTTEKNGSYPRSTFSEKRMVEAGKTGKTAQGAEKIADRRVSEESEGSE